MAHDRTVEGFGREWRRFDQADLPEHELRTIFDQYFSAFDWEELGAGAVGIDVGCGSGRWARFAAPSLARLTCIDASEEAVAVACRNLAHAENVDVLLGEAGALPFPDETFDFGYSLGVLHHTPDTLGALRDCVRVLKPGAPFVLYLYYALDDRPWWFRALWRLSDGARRVVSRLPHRLRFVVADLVALFVYWPFARVARIVESRGRDPENFPLSAYRDRSFYIMRNDALDRLGTQLEQRFTRGEVQRLMMGAGLGDVRFATVAFWCAVGYRT